MFYAILTHTKITLWSCSRPVQPSLRLVETHVHTQTHTHTHTFWKSNWSILQIGSTLIAIRVLGQVDTSTACTLASPKGKEAKCFTAQGTLLALLEDVSTTLGTWLLLAHRLIPTRQKQTDIKHVPQHITSTCPPAHHLHMSPNTSPPHVPQHITSTCPPTHHLHMYHNTSPPHVPQHITSTCTPTHHLHMYPNTSPPHVPQHITSTCPPTHHLHMYPNTSPPHVPQHITSTCPPTHHLHMSPNTSPPCPPAHYKVIHSIHLTAIILCPHFSISLPM